MQNCVHHSKKCASLHRWKVVWTLEMKTIHVSWMKNMLHIIPYVTYGSHPKNPVNPTHYSHVTCPLGHMGYAPDKHGQVQLLNFLSYFWESKSSYYRTHFSLLISIATNGYNSIFCTSFSIISSHSSESVEELLSQPTRCTQQKYTNGLVSSTVDEFIRY